MVMLWSNIWRGMVGRLAGGHHQAGKGVCAHLHHADGQNCQRHDDHDQ